MENNDRGGRLALPTTLATLLPLPAVATGTENFRLFDLPDELWLHIGKMVINDVPAINVRAIRTKPRANEESRGGEMHKGTTISSELTPPAILQTCTALRKELRNGYYREKITVTTAFIVNPPVLATIGRYLRMIGSEARGQIRVVTESAQWRWGPQKGLLRPLSAWGLKYWEWEMMVTPTRVPAAHREDEDQRATEWEITFI